MRAPFRAITRARWLHRARIIGWSGILLTAELLALGFLIAWTHGAFKPIDPPTTTDFVSFYAAGKLALAGTPALAYDHVAHHAAEMAATAPGIEYQFFFYPPVALLLCAPLALLPYLTSFIVFQTATLALWLVVARRILAARGWTWCIPVLAYPAVFWTIGLGQNALLTAALLGAVTLLIDTRPRTAGLLLGLLCYKPHLALLAPIALAAGGHWRAFTAATLTVAAIVALSVACFGLAPWLAYLNELAGARAVYETGRIEPRRLRYPVRRRTTSRPGPDGRLRAATRNIIRHRNDNLLDLAPRRRPRPPRCGTGGRHPAQHPAGAAVRSDDCCGRHAMAGWSAPRHATVSCPGAFCPAKNCCSPSASSCRWPAAMSARG